MIARLEGMDAQIQTLAEQIGDLDSDRRRRTEAIGELRRLESEAQEAKAKAREHLAELAQIESNLAIMRGIGDPYSVTRRAVAEEEPSSPNVPLIIVGSLLAGLAIGVGLTALLEFARPGFRTPSDAVRALTVPVLGVVDHFSTRAQLMRVRIQRCLVGISTVVLLGGLAWIAWAWHEKPELLGTNLAHALNELHESLK